MSKTRHLMIAAAMLAFVLVIAPPSLAGRSRSSDVTQDRSAASSVFTLPSDEELAEITHPNLRRELLHMIAEDQQARSASK